VFHVILRTNSDNFTKQQFVFVMETGCVLSEISGFHGGEYEDDCLVGCFAVQSGRN
jgi:hypothetical protein